MKYLIMCEGPNEKKIIELLLEHNKLNLDWDDLLGRQVYHARQIKNSPVVKTNLEFYKGSVEVLRVGDKQSDKLVIPPEYKNQIKKVTKYCTLPELEMLLILSEKKYKEYDKTKAQKHPKQFAKENISIGKRKYKNDTQFYADYYGENISKLVNAIREYKQKNKSHSAEQHYLVELIKES